MPTLTVGENVAQFDACAWGTGANAGKLMKATNPAGLVVSVVKDVAITSGVSGEFYKICEIVTNPSWSFTAGAPVYLSPTVSGGLTATLPTTSGKVACIVGIATGPTSLWLYPQLVMVEIA